MGYRAKRNSLPVDLEHIGKLKWQDYWEPVHPERGGRIVLEPEVFYLLLSAEGVSIPPSYAAEMLAYDPTAGELRTHYAGFFDPGFGYSRTERRHGSRAALEVRARDVPFMVEHRQPVCKLAFERMVASRTCSTGRTSAPTIRARRRCSASTSPSRPRATRSPRLQAARQLWSRCPPALTRSRRPARSARVRRQQHEMRVVRAQWPHRAEVAFVERGDPGRVQVCRQRDQRGVG